MKARDRDRQQTLSHECRNEVKAALPSPEAKKAFQRQKACVNMPRFDSFRRLGNPASRPALPSHATCGVTVRVKREEATWVGFW
jgi:hypothetical protein